MKMKIVKTNLVDQVAEAIKAMIVNENYQYGTKIPSENDLVAQFGVSRLTVRLAIQKLNVLGICETKTGNGTYVKEFSFNEYLENISDLLIKPDMLHDVYEFRKLIEVEAAVLAMEHGTDEEFEDLKTICKNFDQIPYFPNGDINKYVSNMLDVEFAFHSKICEMSKNELLSYVFTAAKEPIAQYLSVIMRKRMAFFYQQGMIGEDGLWKFGQNPHNAIVNTMLTRNETKCREVYNTLIDIEASDDQVLSI